MAEHEGSEEHYVKSDRSRAQYPWERFWWKSRWPYYAIGAVSTVVAFRLAYLAKNAPRRKKFEYVMGAALFGIIGFQIGYKFPRQWHLLPRQRQPYEYLVEEHWKVKQLNKER
eukprot:TRINITY_DN4494_c0_g1_i2.p1 TRINITY_DN4494_c0_g1~~TRINITY_DN4494_c0_g1_i2.p1  ORF type:complete len:113 (-),score=17.04 TRINITY_DN4494_c0_g1_i2:69-407(-)